MLNVDGWTDGRTDERTNGRKLARLCLPAKADATKDFYLNLYIVTHTKYCMVLQKWSCKYINKHDVTITSIKKTKKNSFALSEVLLFYFITFDTFFDRLI